MNVEELGKTEEIEESASSAELPQVESAGATINNDLAPESETTASDEQTAVKDVVDQDAVAAASAGDVEKDVGAEQNAIVEPEAAASAVAESSEPETAAVVADVAAEASEPATETESSQADSAATEPGPSEPESASVTAEPEAKSSEPETSAVVADVALDETEPATETESSQADSAAAEPAPSEQEAAPEKPDPPKYRRGKVSSGVITRTTPTAVFVDLGDGDEGVVPGRELELMTRKMLESLTVGANVDVYVVNPRNHRGEIVLSINHALEELDWRKAKEFAKSKAVFDALIGGYNKGGLIVRFGRLRGFVPQSQLSEERARGIQGETPEERYGPMVNQPIGVKVMEVDRGRNRLILSERAATREVRQHRKKALIEELRVGEIRKGIVVSLENFGAFIDIGGAEGLVHLSELAWEHITHPRQAVSIGDELEVEVISVSQEDSRIGLSRRRVISDPWDEIATSLRRGQLVRGRVSKLTKFGAFARLVDNDAVEGLIHISELSGERVSHPREVVKRGDELVLRIVKIDIKDRRLGLSLKSVKSTEYLDLDWEMALQDATSPPPVAPADDVEAETEGQAEE